MNRGSTVEEDESMGCFQEGIIKDVHPYETGSGWSITTEAGWGCGVRNVGHEPKPGDTFRTYGYMGYPFHGQELNGHLLWYLSREEQENDHRRQNEEMDQKNRDKFEDERESLDTAYEALPETFQERIDKFRKTNPDWRWQFESYEMMCCGDAIKIASYCSMNRLADGDVPTAAENIVAFGALPWEEQKKAGVDGGHSGNSFGFAVRLAYLWVTDPTMVVAEHGALVPLVGCDKYGCPHLER